MGVKDKIGWAVYIGSLSAMTVLFLIAFVF